MVYPTLSALCKGWGIALTGGIASGKSTVGQILVRQGVPVIDADVLSREIVAPGSEGLEAVVAHFGPTVLQADGNLDRARMRSVVFQNSGERQVLEGIIHSRLAQYTWKALQKIGLDRQPRIWFYEASLIFERNRASDFREVWVAYCPEAVQIQRLMARDGASEADARSILAAQMPTLKKAREADRVIHTDCSEPELESRVLAQLESLGVAR
jgi:dephospho-CoA kinase